MRILFPLKDQYDFRRAELTLRKKSGGTFDSISVIQNAILSKCTYDYVTLCLFYNPNPGTLKA